MRLRALLPALLVLTLGAPAYPQDSNRRKTRVTDPDAVTDDDFGTTAAKKRKHAASLDDSTDSWEPTRGGKASALGDDDAASEKPPPSKRRAKSDATPEEEYDRRTAPTPTPDDDEENDSRHRDKTAEEELSTPIEHHERLANVDEPGNGVAVELAGGPVFLSGATGSSTTHAFAGFIASYQIGRAFAPESWFLHNNFILEFSYLGTNVGDGTQKAQVGAWTHYVALDLLFGYPVPPVLFYAKVGPSLMSMPVSYSLDGVDTSFTGVKVGVVYGLGLRANFYIGDYVGIAARAELVRYRRGYLDDTLLTFGLGVCF